MIRNLLLISSALAAVAAMAAPLEKGNWKIDYEGDALNISYRGTELFKGVGASLTYNIGDDTGEYSISSADIKPQASVESVSDEFGDGRVLVLSFSDSRAVMKQRFALYDGHDFMLVSNTVEGLKGETVRSNHMVPFSVGESSYPVAGTGQRMLWVPFDNNSHSTRYQSNLLSIGQQTSSEVSAIFNATTREGVVAGSVDHDKWKSAVTLRGHAGGRVSQFELMSGYTDRVITKDILPHGKVKGHTVSSARFMIGHFDDWREGMNTFADANCIVAPRFEWTKGNPVGWNSWGNMMDKVDYQGVLDVCNFLKENFWDCGFHDREGKITISLDSFNGNLGDSNINKLGNKIFSEGTYRDGRDTKQGLNMTLGMYGGLVVWGWTFDSKVPGTGIGGSRDYYWRDVVLKANGEPYTHNADQGCYSIDPTHPAVRANLEYQFAQWAKFGCKYVKMDFIDEAIREGDSWYDPEVTTGVMAYNYGMGIVRELAEKYGMYIVESMAPLFPYQYAHGRRVCCDRWSRLQESEFVMNAISYGWWTSRLYTVNDPDQLTLCQNNYNHQETLGENRVRATSGMTTGAYIFGDNFSDNNSTGYPAESRARAMQILTNEDINQYVRDNTGSFMPIEGNNPSSSQHAESDFMRDTPQYLYVAAFNWRTLLERSGKISFERLGIDPANVGAVKELWSGEEITPDADGISYKVPKGDVKVFRITKNDYKPTEGAGDITSDGDCNSVAVNLCGNILNVAATKAISLVSVYGLQGNLVAQGRPNAHTADIALDCPAGVYVTAVILCDGSMSYNKIIKR